MKKQKGIKQLNADMEKKEHELNITSYNIKEQDKWTPINNYNNKLNSTPVATKRLAGKNVERPEKLPLN